MLGFAVYWEGRKNLTGECCASWKLRSNGKIVISNLLDDALRAVEQGAGIYSNNSSSKSHRTKHRSVGL